MIMLHFVSSQLTHSKISSSNWLQWLPRRRNGANPVMHMVKYSLFINVREHGSTEMAVDATTLRAAVEARNCFSPESVCWSKRVRFTMRSKPVTHSFFKVLSENMIAQMSGSPVAAVKPNCASFVTAQFFGDPSVVQRNV
jgi:hypothetical protein